MSDHAHESGKTTIRQAVPRSSFDTRGLSSPKAFARWQEQLEHIAEVRLPKDVDNSFYARSQAVVLDKLVLGDFHTVSQFYDRSRFRIARDSVDHYMLHFFNKGRLICRETGAGSQIKRGDMMVTDLADPAMAALEDLDSLFLVVPRALLAPMLAEPDAPVIRHFSGDGVLVRLLYEHMHALFSQAHHMSVQEARALVPAVLELSAAAINGTAGEQTARGVASSLVQAIHRHVSVHALDPGLSPDRIAAHFGISPRKLSYLFKEEGGIAAHIQQERLRLARLALMDPTQRDKTIAEIAEAHGFSHRTSFIRAFERIYSLTPGQQRALASGRREDDANDMPRPSPFKWIGHF